MSKRSTFGGSIHVADITYNVPLLSLKAVVQLLLPLPNSMPARDALSISYRSCSTHNLALLQDPPSPFVVVPIKTRETLPLLPRIHLHKHVPTYASQYQQAAFILA